MPPSSPVDPELIERKFKLELLQPFLERPLSQIEIELVDHWIKYYKKQFDASNGQVHSSSMRPGFRSYLLEQGYSDKLFTHKNGGEDIRAFQNLFIAAPEIDFFTAIKRCTGHMVQLSEVEIYLGFREAVAYHQQVTQSNLLPTWDDFDRYNAQGVFLPNTGILFPSSKSYTSRHRLFTTKNLSFQYARHFDIPEEISTSQLHTVRGHQKNFRNLVEKLKTFREEIQESIPEHLDEFDYEEEFEDHYYFQGMVRISKFFRIVDKHTPDFQKLLKKMMERFGKVNQKPLHEIEAPDPSFGRAMPRKSPNSTTLRTLTGYQQLWRAQNPNDVLFSQRFLCDPPSVKKVKRLGILQKRLFKEHGELNFALCDSLGIPTSRIPTVYEINQYPKSDGTAGGILQLLRDIENRVWTKKDETLEEIMANSDGIVFSGEKNRQLAMLKNMYIKSQDDSETLDLTCAPRAVIRAAAIELGLLMAPITVNDL